MWADIPVMVQPQRLTLGLFVLASAGLLISGCGINLGEVFTGTTPTPSSSASEEATGIPTKPGSTAGSKPAELPLPQGSYNIKLVQHVGENETTAEGVIRFGKKQCAEDLTIESPMTTYAVVKPAGDTEWWKEESKERETTEEEEPSWVDGRSRVGMDYPLLLPFTSYTGSRERQGLCGLAALPLLLNAQEGEFEWDTSAWRTFESDGVRHWVEAVMQETTATEREVTDIVTSVNLPSSEDFRLTLLSPVKIHETDGEITYVFGNMDKSVNVTIVLTPTESASVESPTDTVEYPDLSDESLVFFLGSIPGIDREALESAGVHLPDSDTELGGNATPSPPPSTAPTEESGGEEPAEDIPVTEFDNSKETPQPTRANGRLYSVVQ